jgi:hypothetical protein
VKAKTRSLTAFLLLEAYYRSQPTATKAAPLRGALGNPCILSDDEFGTGKQRETKICAYGPKIAQYRAPVAQFVRRFTGDKVQLEVITHSQVCRLIGG